MNSNNIVKIGTALKWRGTFDENKRYYQENIITMCGCVFRCKILLTQGNAPVSIIDDEGHITYQNLDIWDVVVDMVSYYNFVVDCKNAVKKIGDAVKNNTDLIGKQQKILTDIISDNSDQWDYIEYLQEQIDAIIGDSTTSISAIEVYIENHEKEHRSIDDNIGRIVESIEKMEDDNESQQNQINILFDNISVYTSGLWSDDLLWANHLNWRNGLNDCDCDEQIQELRDKLIKLQETCNSQQTIINKQQQQIDQLISGIA